LFFNPLVAVLIKLDITAGLAAIFTLNLMREVLSHRFANAHNQG
jgi:hypothetical protein